ncbi:DUF2599 domain-containing protein [Nocardia sp. NPDC052566]|uniref:DUF2599 domain-containing protein n=1 Tax=Nocardia sp. NPDC052566 TaxID=3364330 RepID=UPI0037C56E84
MSQRLRTSAALLCAALLSGSLSLAACGSDSPTATTPSAATPATTTPTPPSSTPTTVPLASTALPVPSVDPFAGQPLIDHTSWTENIDGARLLVFPTPAGRQTTFPGAEERAWREVLADSPDAETPGMRDQFVCHWVWARLVQPNKPSWNLEPWRPAVGYQATVDASCNPGGPER